MVKSVVEAYVMKVVEATSESGVPVSQSPVEVETTIVPLYVVGVKSNPLPT